jgi:hypothetical protein
MHTISCAPFRIPPRARGRRITPGMTRHAPIAQARRRANPPYQGRPRLSRLVQTLLRFQVHRFDDRPPPVNFLRLEGSKGCRGLLIAYWNFLAQTSHPTLDSLVRQCINNGCIELGNDVLRRAFGCPHARPDRNVETRKTGFVHRGDVRRGGETRLGGDSVGLDTAITHMRQGVRRLIEQCWVQVRDGPRPQLAAGPVSSGKNMPQG